MTDTELKNALITELLNTMPFHKILDLVKGFAEAVAEQQLTEITDEQRAQLIARFNPEAPTTEEAAPTNKTKKKAKTK